MYNPELEGLIDAALADGELTEKEKQILFKKAQAMGVDLDEFEMVLDARLVKYKKAEAEKAASSAPKSNKLGDVKKCPACGAMVQSYQGVCPECGYAFEGVDANSSVKELSSLLQREADQGKMEKIIDNYPIPMEKAALLAFVTWLRPQSTDDKNPLSKTYNKKYAECINKIRVSFSTDKELQSFIAYYQEDEKKIKKQNIIKLTLKNKWFWIGIGILIILLLFLAPSPTKKIEKALKEGDTPKAVSEFLAGGTFELGVAEAVIDACLADGNFSDAKRVGVAAGMNYNSLNIFDEQKAQKRIAEKIYEYCISQGDFSSAKEIILSDGEYKYWGTYISDVVKYLCEHGKKDEASQFLKANSSHIDDKYDELGLDSYPTKNGGTTLNGDREYVTKKLEKMIAEY